MSNTAVQGKLHGEDSRWLEITLVLARSLTRTCILYAYHLLVHWGPGVYSPWHTLD